MPRRRRHSTMRTALSLTENALAFRRSHDRVLPSPRPDAVLRTQFTNKSNRILGRVIREIELEKSSTMSSKIRLTGCAGRVEK